MSRFELRVRLSFPGLSRSLPETGQAMEAWAHAAARILAPELRWSAEVRERGDAVDDSRWASTRVVRLSGRTPDETPRGRGEVRLAAGGDLAQVGGNALVELEAVRPVRYLVADNHCDVTHWDLLASPVDEGQIEALVRALEAILGQDSERGGERRDPVSASTQRIGPATAEDAAIWLEDLEAVGLSARGQASADGSLAVFVERSQLDEVLDLEEARTTLGEILAEAGHEDWYERARALLARLPSPGEQSPEGPAPESLIDR